MKKNLSFQNWRMTASLGVLILVGGNALAQSATAPSATKDALLRNTVRDVIVPGYQKLAVKSQALTAALEDFSKTPTQQSLEQARKAWVGALLASRQIQWLQSGPVADRECIASFCYAKVLPARIDEVLNSTRAIDESYLGELGATAKGMFALEYLLFGRKTNPAETNVATTSVLELFSHAEAPRRRQYALTLAQDLETKAGQLAKDWTAAGDQSAAAKFVADGQDSLNRVVNHLAQIVEQVAEERINFVLQLQPPIERQFDRIEGSPSGTSLQSAAALLQGAQELFRGGDAGRLEAYLKQLNAPLAERTKGMFETAIVAVQAVGAPLEDVVPKNRAPIEIAYEKTRALEVVCKADLASALGVTITFNAGDGD